MLKKAVSITLEIFLGKKALKLSVLRVSRNQRFSLPLTTVEQELSSQGNLYILEPGHYLAPPKFNFFISPWNFTIDIQKQLADLISSLILSKIYSFTKHIETRILLLLQYFSELNTFDHSDNIRNTPRIFCAIIRILLHVKTKLDPLLASGNILKVLMFQHKSFPDKMNNNLLSFRRF